MLYKVSGSRVWGSDADFSVVITNIQCYTKYLDQEWGSDADFSVV